MPKRIISAASLIAMAVIPGAAQEPLVFDEPSRLDTGAIYGNLGNMQLASDSASHWVVAWESRLAVGELGWDLDILLSHTYDGGLTWTAPVPLNNDASGDSSADDKSLRLIAGKGGVWVATWLRKERAAENWSLMVARSHDSGVTWSDPQLIVEPDSYSVARRHHLELASDPDGNFMLLWSLETAFPSYPVPGGRTYFVSVDSGESWSGPATVTDRYGFIGDIVIPAGADSFLALAVRDNDLFAMRTTDSGRTWNPAAAVIVGRVATYPRMGAAQDGAGNLVVVLTAVEAVSRKLYLAVARSSDGGATWSEPHPLGLDTQFDTRSHSSNAIQVATDGEEWLAVWRTPPTLSFSVSRDAGLTWTLPREVEPPIPDSTPFHLAAGRGVPFGIAHKDDEGWESDSNRMVVSSEFDHERGWLRTIPVIDRVVTVDQPDIASGSDGRWGAVWRRKLSENSFELYASRSGDLGATWSEPRLVFDTTIRNVRVPRIVAGGRGHWAVAFQYAESEQSDGQLYIAHSDDDTVTWSRPVRFDNVLPVHRSVQGIPGFEITVSTSGEWLATWRNRERGSLASISRDAGRNWSVPREIPLTLKTGNIEVAAPPDGGWLIAWPDRGMHLAASTDGATWSELSTNMLEEGERFLGRPRLSIDPNGSLLLAYENESYFEFVDEHFPIAEGRARRSLDGGLTWTPPSELYTSHRSVFPDSRDPPTITQNLGPDDWLVLYAGRGKRSTRGGEWLEVERPDGYFDRVSSDGFGNSIAIRDAHSAGSFIETVRFGLPSASYVVADDSGADSPDTGGDGTQDGAPGTAGPAAPGLPCPLAAVVLLAAGPVILLAGRRGRIR